MPQLIRIVSMLSLLLFVAVPLQAQKLSSSPDHSQYTYLFPLHPDSVLLLDKWPMDYAFFYRQISVAPVDSFLTYTQDSTHPPTGAYLKAYASRNRLYFSVKQVNTFEVRVYNNDRDLLIAVIDRETGNILGPSEQVTVQLEGKPLAYDQELALYRRNRNNKEGRLTISRGQEMGHWQVERNRNNPLVWRVAKRVWNSKPISLATYPGRLIYYPLRESFRFGFRFSPLLSILQIPLRPFKRRWEGYVVLNQPKYQPGDTVFWKAHFINRKGWGIRGKYKVLLRGQYGEEEHQLGMHKASKGSLSGWFLVSDSLKIDQRYSLNIKTVGGKRTLESGELRVEDYQLNTTSYDLRIAEKEHYPGQGQVLYFSGKDANGLNLLDARVEVTVNRRIVKKFVGEEGRIPDVIWSESRLLEPVGETRIDLPDSIFPKAEVEYEVEAVFNNSNNETHQETKRFTHYPYREKLFIETDGGEIIARYLKDGKSVPHTGRLVAVLNSGDTLFSEAVDLPYAAPLHPLVANYILEVGDLWKITETSWSSHQLEVTGKHLGDSVKLKMENPNGLPVHFSLLKRDNQEINSWQATALDTAWKSTPGKSYFLSYHFVWQGDAYDQSVALHHFQKQLKVSLDAPDQVLPGQKEQVAVLVTNQKGRPMKGVDVTVGSVNEQFEDFRLPRVPYLGKGKRRRKAVNSFRENVDKLDGVLSLTPQLRPLLHLDTSLHFQMRYPQNGWYSHREAIESYEPQFAIHAVDSNGKFQTIYLIYCNGELLYNRFVNKSETYSFFVPSGKTTVQIRTQSGLYTLSGITFEKGYKHDIVFNVDALPKHIEYKPMGSHLHDWELYRIKKSTCTITGVPNGKTCYLTQGHRTWRIEPHHSGPVGPLHSGPINFHIPGMFDVNINYLGSGTYKVDSQIFIHIPEEVYVPEKRLVYTYEDGRLGQVRKTRTEILKADTPVVDTQQTDLPRVWIPNKLYTGPVGAYAFDYQGDSVLNFVALVCLDSVRKPRIQYRATGRFSKVPAGIYRLVLHSSGGHYAIVDSVKIKEDELFWQRFQPGFWQATSDSINHMLHTDTWSAHLPQPKINQRLYSPNGGEISGSLVGGRSGEAIPFANIVLKKHQVGTLSDFEGNFKLEKIPAGVYDLEISFIGYETLLLESVKVRSNRATRLGSMLLKPSSVHLEEFQVVSYSMPLIEASATRSTSVMKAQSVGGVYSRDELAEVSIVGAAELQSLPGVQMTPPELETPVTDNLALSGAAASPLMLRENFRDYAYWQPSLRTDRNGQATFDVRFPDDITAWRNYAIAMDGQKGSGVGQSITRSYKMLSANLAMPRFLLEGDSTGVIGKSLNYSPEEQSLQTAFTVGDQAPIWKAATVTNSLIEYQSLEPQSPDTLSVSYLLRKGEDYSDGERRELPVFPVGTMEIDGWLATLTRDSSLSFAVHPEHGPLTVTAHRNSTDFLLAELNALQSYPHACMEQTASKLWGYLMEQQIRGYLKEAFKHQKEVKRLIQRLDDHRRVDGSWGWWPGSPENRWMTAYVARVLHKAKAAGYDTPNLQRTGLYLFMNLPSGSVNEQLEMLEALLELDYSFPGKKTIEGLEKNKNLSDYQRLRLMGLRQQLHMDYNEAALLSAKKRTRFRNTYWGTVSYGWYDNHIQQTLLAYQILERSDSLHPLLPSIRDFFLELRQQNGWRNTIESARILATILPGMLRAQSGDEQPAFLLVNGEKITAFPFEHTFAASTGMVQFEKQGIGTLYLSAYQNYWTATPKAQGNEYAVQTWWEVDGKRVVDLKAGEVAELKVEVVADSPGEYVMISVPIPGGCSYDAQNYWGDAYEVHREKFRDRTQIYCQKLPEGKHTFTVRVQPRFAGRYTLNPARVEQMYFPVFNAQTGLRKTVIAPVAP